MYAESNVNINVTGGDGGNDGNKPAARRQPTGGAERCCSPVMYWGCLLAFLHLIEHN